MKINRLFLASIIIMTFIMVAGVTSAQNIAGVSAGDQFTYDFSVYFKSTNPDIVIPQAWIEDNKTQWLKINVINVTDPIVAYSITQHLENGTEQITEDQMNLETGYGGFPIAMKDLQSGDPIFPSDAASPIINETITENYPDGSREINHATWSEESGNYDLKLDKNSGIPIEFHAEFPVDANSTAEYAYELIGSNIWAIPEFTTPYIQLTIVIMAVSSTVIYFKKFKSKSTAKR
jgi:hypothetical protein